MPTCFVMQPFDDGVFDRRYDDVFAPAVRAAGLEPYRVDQDPAVSIPIQEIERGIRSADLCLAEITLDNPNVWFELGFAIALGKEVVLVCSDERTTRFPFDVQHRSIITYSTKSISDYEKLKLSVTARIGAYLKKSETLANVSEISMLTKFNGLDQHEVVALAAIAQNFEHPEDHTSTFQIKRDMESSGLTKIATTLALRALTEKGLIQFESYPEEYGDGYYAGYKLTERGWSWILANQGKFVLSRETEIADDNLPF